MLHFPIPSKLYEVDPQTGCWNYTGTLNKAGRPAASTFGMPMFRAICWMKNGPPPDETFHAAHVCHNRRCINPEHSEWQHPDVNNPRKEGSEYECTEQGVRVKMGRRRSNKGDGRVVEGWFARFTFGGKNYKSGAYYSKDSALHWARNKIRVLTQG